LETSIVILGRKARNTGVDRLITAPVINVIKLKYPNSSNDKEPDRSNLSNWVIAIKIADV
jgi:hypothetical protein